MKRLHKCPACGRTWKHHRGLNKCPVTRRNAPRYIELEKMYADGRRDLNKP